MKNNDSHAMQVGEPMVFGPAKIQRIRIFDPKILARSSRLLLRRRLCVQKLTQRAIHLHSIIILSFYISTLVVIGGASQVDLYCFVAFRMWSENSFSHGYRRTK